MLFSLDHKVLLFWLRLTSENQPLGVMKKEVLSFHFSLSAPFPPEMPDTQGMQPVDC